MFLFVAGYTRPDGSVPQIGDTDDARLYIFSNLFSWPRDNHLYLLPFASKLFGHQYTDIELGGYGEESTWVLSALMRDGFIKTPVHHSQKIAINKSMAFPDSGFYFMKSDHTSVAISANPVGLKGKGNHKHNDIFSFDLFYEGKPLIIDPGSYVL
jgi:hypothetical protein